MPKSIVHNCDCIEIMKTMQDHSVLLLTDPPYSNPNGGFKRQDKSRFGGTFDRYKRESQPELNIGGVEEVKPMLSSVPVVRGRRSMAKRLLIGTLHRAKSISMRC